MIQDNQRAPLILVVQYCAGANSNYCLKCSMFLMCQHILNKLNLIQIIVLATIYSLTMRANNQLYTNAN